MQNTYLDFGEGLFLNVIILTVTAGYGHLSVSKALEQYIEKKGDTAETIDILEHVSPIINRVFTEYYIRAIKYIPEAYSRIYKKEAQKALGKPKKLKKVDKKLVQKKDQKIDITIADIFNKLVMERKFIDLFDKKKPDIIISTHPFIGELLELPNISRKIKEKDGLDAKVITVVTDYVAHPSWLNEATDYYIYPTEKLKYAIENISDNKNIEDKIKYYGIPISENFLLKLDKDELRKTYDISKDNFLYLIMGGGYGIGDIKKDAGILLEKDVNSEVFVVCGNNKELYCDIKKLKETDNGDRLHFCGFTQDMHKLMNMADVIITKPGGVTITEAMSAQIPIVIREYLPGQEEKNTEFILNHHMGIYTAEDTSFLAYLEMLKNDEMYREGIISNIKSIKKSDTLENIYRLMKEIS